jgi:hypothetical protein
MSSLSTLPKGDSAWLLRKSIQRIMQQVSVLETNIGSSTTGNSSNTQVIFNDNGTLRGDAGLTYNAATDTLSAGSATITGDLTVDTNVLKVDSTNNRVGVGTATPSAALDVNGASNLNGNVTIANTGSPFGTLFVTGSALELQANSNATNGLSLKTTSATPIVFGINGSTAMTLNSTGLGVGGVPSYKLDVQGTSAGVLRLVNILNLSTDPAAVTRLSLDGQGATWHLDNERTNGIFKITRNSTACLTIDNSGNVGIGVTPSAWVAGAKALQFGAYGALAQSSSGNIELSFNSYNSGAGAYKYLQTDTASLYRASSVHSWFIAPSGTAGNSVTWTQAMTLDASGNLLVGTTNSASNAGIGLKASYSATAPYFATVGSSNASNFYSYLLYSTTDAAFKFYVSYSGTVSATNGTISAISDQRLKENVEDIDVGLGAILALKPRKFDWKAGKGKDIKGDRGFIAQEFEQVFPNLVDEWKDAAPEGEAPYKSVRQDLIPVLVKAIQELTARVEALEA